MSTSGGGNAGAAVGPVAGVTFLSASSVAMLEQLLFELQHRVASVGPGETNCVDLAAE